MQGLIRNYTKQKLTNIQGPVTVVTNKKRRLTIIECNNDLNSMIDVAKVADLVSKAFFFMKFARHFSL